HLDQMQRVAGGRASDDAVVAMDDREMLAARAVVGGVQEVIGGRADDLVDPLAVALVDHDGVLATSNLRLAIQERMGWHRIRQQDRLPPHCLTCHRQIKHDASAVYAMML